MHRRYIYLETANLVYMCKLQGARAPNTSSLATPMLDIFFRIYINPGQFPPGTISLHTYDIFTSC